MTTPEIEPENTELPDEVLEDIPAVEKGEGLRRLLLLLQVGLLIGLVAVGTLFVRYILKPQPLPQLLPASISGDRCYLPTYKASIANIDRPFSIAVSPDSQRIYVSELTGERMIKMYDRDGAYVTQFAPPGTNSGSHSPTYIAVNNAGRVFVVDTYSNAIDIFDADGKFIDAIIGQDMTLTKALSSKGVALDGLIMNRYDMLNNTIYYQSNAGGVNKKLKLEAPTKYWDVSGIRFDRQGNLIYTDVSAGMHSVHIIPAAALDDLNHFDPKSKEFGTFGVEPEQLNFPQSAVTDSKGNYYVSDGNNSRITVWSSELKYATFFGFGGTDGALNLPRGIWMDPKDCLLVADTVGSTIIIYDVSGNEPKYSHSFGSFGVTEGEFNYPNDVTIDGTGRLYVTDSGNNRVQIWSY